MDYNNGKIYVIRNHCNDMVYVGSTTQSLSKRFSWHKNSKNSKRCKHYQIYQAMNELDISNFYIELVEEYPCDNKEQLCAKEGYYIREFDSYNNGYNARMAGRTKKQYCKENKEHIINKSLLWYEENKVKKKEYDAKRREEKRDYLNQQKRDYYKDNKDTIKDYQKTYYENNKEKVKNQVKQYQEDNKQKIKDKRKTYYENNKEKVKEREKNKEKFHCSCGSIITQNAKARHLKTKKHLSYVSSI